MYQNPNKFVKKRILLIFSLRSFGQNNTENQDKVSKETKEKFKPGDMILEHIGDAYEWHIVSFGHNKPISIPLPVLVYSKKTGFHAFISSKFEHGEKSFDGLQLAGEESPNKGKIIEMIDGKETRPIDISITKNTLSLFISLAFILWLFISIAKTYQRREGMAPKGIQSLLEPIILFVRDDIAKASIGEKKYVKYTPYLLSIFFFIFLNNLLGLIPIFPGGANLTGNIAITMVLALFTFVITTVNANKNYWKHIINAPGVPWWLKLPVPLMPIVEIIGVFTKPFVLMIRLFANITAGHIIALGFFSLIFIFGEMSAGAGYGMSVLSVSFTVFMSMLELLVAFIQAYVFTLLSALYFGMATEEHH
jgi:F-type H+-transporting ATPase subunit a